MSEPTRYEHAETSIEVPAVPADVWRAIITTDDTDSWHGEGSVLGETPGESLYIADPATGRAKSGIVERVIPNERLEYTWWPIEDPDEASRVTITMLPSPIGTLITVQERPLSAQASSQACARVLARC